MNSSLYIGATGLKTHSSGLHTLANNLANVSTVGYKQQSILFEDLMYAGKPCLGSAWPQVFNQAGMGAQVGAVRTLFTEGAFEPSNTVTDLALAGKGFFQVSKDGKEHYTRAGNFRFDMEGWLKDPNGYVLTGIPITDGQKTGGLAPIKLNLNPVVAGESMFGNIVQSPAKASTQVTSIVNLGFKSNATDDPDNPCFSLIKAWDGTKVPPPVDGQPGEAMEYLSVPPLAAGLYGYAQPMRVYGANGDAYTVTMYFDATSLGAGGNTLYEYVVTLPPELDGGPAKGTPGAGLLMAGTLTFSPAGEVIDMSAFSPGGGDYKDLANWTPSSLVNGKPQVALTTAKGENISFTLNLGISGVSGSWSNPPATAAEVGAVPGYLPSLGEITREATATTARGASSNLALFQQDGYPVGSLNGLDITADGRLVASYTNGQSLDLYEIPVFRFTSEDGLHHEGRNHYSYTPAAGAMEYGTAGTFNYGKIIAYKLEMSNVDMAREMVNMIMMQRGFQMNSKSITTTDTMLQRALELKR
ncbi:MAG: flagellar hook-basal body complex protein [Deltaproteobacteria bacterium]|jgi:flagellar hook protein FlgE|nr:flagellar hook-basal body complex protein [Deltaproteobacteria bacterium]